MKYKCLSIAGFDGSGGAGIQADLKTFSALGCYGMNILTAIPVQNTCGVRSCYPLQLQCIEDQFETIFDDITPDSIKIGMLFSAEIIEITVSYLKKYASNIPIILDPVMVAKSGDVLLLDDAANALREKLLPLATIVTPNIPEAEVLASRKGTKNELAKIILEFGCKNILLKGGHEEGSESIDLLLNKTDEVQISTPRLNSKNTHGTGCTLSAAIASCLAKKHSVIEACHIAKDYVYNAIKAAQHDSVGRGFGPVNHFYNMWK